MKFAGAGLDALCRVRERWIAYFYDICVAIQPVQKITDERWVWHIGLDAEGNALLNDLYNGIEVGEGRLAQLLSLFRMDFRDSSVMAPEMAGRPAYLAMAIDRKSTRLNSVTNAHLVCRLLLEKKKKYHTIIDIDTQ